MPRPAPTRPGSTAKPLPSQRNYAQFECDVSMPLLRSLQTSNVSRSHHVRAQHCCAPTCPVVNIIAMCVDSKSKATSQPHLPTIHPQNSTAPRISISSNNNLCYPARVENSVLANQRRSAPANPKQPTNFRATQRSKSLRYNNLHTPIFGRICNSQ